MTVKKGLNASVQSILQIQENVVSFFPLCQHDMKAALSFDSVTDS